MNKMDVMRPMDPPDPPADERPELFVRQVEDRARPAGQVLTEQQSIRGDEPPARNFVP